MKIDIHKSRSRGHANHGWLDTHHSFSFASYFRADRMGFGALRVLNDDVIAPGGGFGMHGHDNMEIITIPLTGELEHQDNMGNVQVISKGDIQVMSAGAGVYHSEFNRSESDETHLLQIWVFPNARGVTPRYDLISLNELHESNQLYQILSPRSDDQGVWIHQNAWFFMGEFNKEKNDTYTLQTRSEDDDRGVYAFCIEGEFQMGDVTLSKRDGACITNTRVIELTARSKGRILLIDVPLKHNW